MPRTAARKSSSPRASVPMATSSTNRPSPPQTDPVVVRMVQVVLSSTTVPCQPPAASIPADPRLSPHPDRSRRRGNTRRNRREVDGKVWEAGVDSGVPGMRRLQTNGRMSRELHFPTDPGLPPFTPWPPTFSDPGLIRCPSPLLPQNQIPVNSRIEHHDLSPVSRQESRKNPKS